MAHCSGNPSFDIAIRDMDSRQQIMAITSLEGFIELHLGIDIEAQENGQELSAELQALLVNQFPMLSTGEIKQAFTLAAAGKLDSKPVAYYNRLTVQMFGELFASYMRWRTKAKRALAQAEKETKAQQRLEQMQGLAPQLHASWLEQMQEWVLDAEAGKVVYTDWENIPARPAEVFAKAFPSLWDAEQKKAIWERAKKLAAAQKKKEAQEHSDRMGGSATALAKVLSRIDQDPTGQGVAALAKAYYSKLLFWEQVKGPALAAKEAERQRRLEEIAKFKQELKAAKDEQKKNK